MKLYDKQLNSLEALKREKARLNVRKSYSKASDLMPVRDVKKKGSQGIISALFAAANSNSRPQQLMALAGPVLAMLRNRQAKKQATAHAAVAAGHPRKPSFLKRAATEVIGGYIRWKAIEVGINALKLVLKSRKRKREAKRRMPMH